MKGGGLGIGGDVVDGLARGDAWTVPKIMLGPIAGGAIVDATRAAISPSGNSFRRAAGWMVPGSEAWYARLATERLLVDQIHRMVDSDADREFRKKEKKLRKGNGSFWWKPGAITP